MRVIFGLGQSKRRFKKPIVAMGVFDGVHLGHQFLLRKVVSRARKIKGTSMVVTFYPHPSHVLNPRRELPLLISLKERLRLFSDLGIEVGMVIRFSKGFSKIKAEDFIRNYIVAKLHPREIYVGSDFVFGSDRRGKVKLLKGIGQRIGFKCQAVSPLKTSGKVVSSTLIRNLLQKNRLRKAAKLLNRPVSISGRVIRGTRKGKVLGFPTANLKDYEGVLPRQGVYAARVIWGKNIFYGMAYIGRRPSFITPDPSQSVEVHIFNFKKEIYGEKIEIEFLKKIRGERRFTNPASLISQLKRDHQLIRKIVQLFC